MLGMEGDSTVGNSSAKRLALSPKTRLMQSAFTHNFFTLKDNLILPRNLQAGKTFLHKLQAGGKLLDGFFQSLFLLLQLCLLIHTFSLFLHHSPH